MTHRVVTSYIVCLVSRRKFCRAPRSEEVLEFLLNRHTPEAIVAFKASPTAQARIRALIENNREATLNATETAELDLDEHLEHLMMLLKA